MTGGLVALFAFCCGAIVTNLYYAQPITELIAPDLGMSSNTASLIVSLTQIGYALGLFFLVPLGDLLENRKLMLTTLLVAIASLAAASVTHQPGWFLAISLVIGISSVAVQLLIPLAAHFAPDATRGRIVGNIMSGLLLGILFSRPISSFMADYLGWRAVFAFGAGLMVFVALVIFKTIPSRQPSHQASYGQLIASLGHLFTSLPTLRQRCLYQGTLFGSFTLFWTAVPVELTRNYGFSQSQIALFALIGATGACSAPLAGRLADAGHGALATRIALIVGIASYLPSLLQLDWGIVSLAFTGIVLDFAVQMHMVTGQREIYMLSPSSRNRLTALYITSIFLGGAVGSACASPLYEYGGWHAVAILAAAFPAVSLLHYLLKR
jgi:predicted MFS family arabinose efflux permease